MATLRQRLMMRLVNLYPPYLGAGIRVTQPKGDPHRVVVRLGLHFWNRNLFGTQFGGSLYSMCDPIFLFIVSKNLGPAYQVWDKAAQIEFKKPGRGRVTATFVVPAEKIDEIREAADRGEKIEPIFEVDVVGDDGEIVAHVTKRLWVARKREKERKIS